MASPSAGATALKYGDVNTVTPSPGEVKGLKEGAQPSTVSKDLAASLVLFFIVYILLFFFPINFSI